MSSARPKLGTILLSNQKRFPVHFQFLDPEPISPWGWGKMKYEHTNGLKEESISQWSFREKAFPYELVVICVDVHGAEQKISDFLQGIKVKLHLHPLKKLVSVSLIARPVGGIGVGPCPLSIVLMHKILMTWLG
jgi:hypothetical protein